MFSDVLKVIQYTLLQKARSNYVNMCPIQKAHVIVHPNMSQNDSIPCGFLNHKTSNEKRAPGCLVYIGDDISYPVLWKL